MQFSSARNNHFFSFFFQFQADVGFQLFNQSFQNLPGICKFPSLPAKGEVLAEMAILMVGSSRLILGKASGLCESGNGVANCNVWKTGNSTMSPAKA